MDLSYQATHDVEFLSLADPTGVGSGELRTCQKGGGQANDGPLLCNSVKKSAWKTNEGHQRRGSRVKIQTKKKSR